MAKDIALILTVLPVGPRDITGPLPNLETQWFAMLLSAAYRNTAADVLAAKDELLPWYWNRINKITVLAKKLLPPETPEEYDLLGATISMDSIRFPYVHLRPDGTSPVDVIKVQVSGRIKGDDTRTQPHLVWQPDDYGAFADPTVHEDLAFLSTLPGGIPQYLNLVTYFQITGWDDTTIGRDGRITAFDEIESFIAVPDISIGDESDGPDLMNLPTFVEGANIKWMDGWEYTGNRRAFVRPLFCRERDRHEYGATPVLETPDGVGPSFDTYWIKSEGIGHTAMDNERYFRETQQAFARIWQAASAPISKLKTADLTEDERINLEEAIKRWRRVAVKSLAYLDQWPPERDLNRAVMGFAQLLKLTTDVDKERLQSELQLLYSDLNGQTSAGIDAALALRTFLNAVSWYLPVLFARIVRTGAVASDDSFRYELEQLAASQLSPDVPDEVMDDRVNAIIDVAIRLPQIERSMLEGMWLFGANRAGFYPLEEDPDRTPDENLQIDIKQDRDLHLFFETLAAGERAKSANVISQTARNAIRLEPRLNPSIAMTQVLEREITDIVDSVEAMAIPNIDLTSEISSEEMKLQIGWSTYVQSFVGQLVKQVAFDPDEGTKQVKPQGISIQLGEITADQPTPPGDDNDPWGKIAGIGVLVGEVRDGHPHWRLPSMSPIYAGAFDLTAMELPESFFQNDAPALVPFRIGFRNGVRRPIVTYNQESFSGPNPLSKVLQKQYDLIGAPSSEVPLYHYGPIRDDSLVAYKLARLIYGRTYKMAAFVIDQAGGLPEALAGEMPWQLSDAQEWDIGDDPEVVKEFVYNRQVSIGQIRIVGVQQAKNNEEGEDASQAWQVVHADCLPIANELGIVAQQVQEKKELSESVVGVTPAELLLLQPSEFKPDAPVDYVPVDYSYVVTIRPPACDIDVLERWADEDQFNSNYPQVLKDYLKNRSAMEEESEPDPSKPGPDISIDDPAVDGILLVLETCEFKFDTKDIEWKIAGAQHIDLRDFRTNSGEPLVGLARYQTHISLRFKFSTADTEMADPDPSLKSVEISLNVLGDSPSIYRLRMCAMVPNGEDGNQNAVGRFPGEFFENIQILKDEFKDPDGIFPVIDTVFENNVCLQPIERVIEVANEKLPTEAQLWTALTIQKVDNLAQTLDIRLNSVNHDASRNLKFLNVGHATLLKLQWYWTGRPIGSLPARFNEHPDHWFIDDRTTDGEAIEELLNWENQAFVGVDPELDVERITGPYSPFTLSVPWQEDFSMSPASQYVLYGVEVESRYRGLYPTLGRKVGQQSIGTEPLAGPGWHRVVVPYRGPYPRKPVVNAIVPLTHDVNMVSDEEQKMGLVSRLMVVFDETVFSTYGVRDSVACRIEVTPIKQTGNNRVLEYGPDAIFTTENSGHDDHTPDSPMDLPLTGPFGHTFDSGARRPLFVTSSYLIHPPADCRPWDFAMISFRRRVHGIADAPDTEDEQWTTPVWVQFLPNAYFGSRWDDPVPNTVTAEHYANCVLNTLENTLVLNVNELLTEPTSEQGSMLQYVLLVTQEVDDFRGRSEQEVYLHTFKPVIGTIHIDTPGTTLTCNLQLMDNPATRDRLYSKSRLRVRLVEVQVVPKNRSGGLLRYPSIPLNDQNNPEEEFNPLTQVEVPNFWKQLLSDNGNSTEQWGDSRYRVTRMSPPCQIIV